MVSQVDRYNKHDQRFQVRMSITTLLVFIPFLIFVGFVLRWNARIFQAVSTEPSDQLLSALKNVEGLIANLSMVNNTDDDGKDAETRSRFVADLPPCAAKGRASTFLMVFQGHSGSTALMTSLVQHSETFITGLEPLDHAPFVDIRTGRTHMNGSINALNYTETFFSNATQHGQTVGFKVRPNHLLKLPTEFSDIVSRYSTRIIWSYRANILKQSVGDYRIHHYKDSASYEGLRVHKNGTAAVPATRAKSFRINNTDELLDMVKRRARADKVLSEAVSAIARDGCILPVSYESYLKDPDLTLERVQRFLGLNASERHAAQRAKANGDSLCELLENFEDVCEAFFACAELRWMLEDVENGCSCTSMMSSSLSLSSKECNVYSS